MRPITLSTLCSLALLLAACNRSGGDRISRSFGGDPKTGKEKIEQYGCAGCHTIPGIPRAVAIVGPSLAQVASRNYIGGVADNTPENMIRWIQDPQAISPRTGMPNLHVTEPDARNIASYLYTLR